MISTVSLSFNTYSLIPKNKCTSRLLRSHFLSLVVFSSPMGREIVTFYCRAWIMHPFGCVLFPDGTGDTALWMYLPCVTDWDTTEGYSWASRVLGFMYRQLCEACHWSSQELLVRRMCLPASALYVVSSTGRSAHSSSSS